MQDGAEIVCAVGPDRGSAEALAFTQELARRSQARFNAVHVLEQTLHHWPFAEPLPLERLEELGENVLREATRGLAPEPAPRLHCRQGHPGRELVEFAEELPADLLVLGRHAGGLLERLIGGTAQRVLRHLPCPLLVYKASSLVLPRNILVPLDLSEPSRAALRTAIHHARLFDAAIRVIYVFEHPEFYPGFPVDAWKVIQDARKSEMETLDALLEEVDWQGVHHDVMRRDGEPMHQILEEAEDGAIDLVIMGSSGRTGFERMLVGSVAEYVVNKCPTSVMVVKAAPASA